jgi:ubiquinone/menaquinone biosynthesis C-methylase UbiE
MDKQTKQEKDMKMLEVAGGTGRFMTFFRDNYPEMDATLLDLSPFYLEEARNNDDYYRSFFKSNDDRRDDYDSDWEISPLKLVQGNAENLEEFEQG